MLMPDYFEGKADRMIELYRKLEEFIMKDVARRILASQKLTATADRMVWKTLQMGEHKAAILKKLSAFTKMTTAEIKTLLQDAVLTSWDDDAEIWRNAGKKLSNPLENSRVREVMDAEFKKSAGELENLTRTTMDQSQQNLINMLNDAEMRVSSGMQSYDAAVNQILDEYGQHGVMVKYKSGAQMSLEAAVRLCVVTSMNQTAAQVSNQYVNEIGTNYVLTSAHYGARIAREGQPECADHSGWQGKVFCIEGSEPGIPNLLEATGYTIDRKTGAGTVVDPLGLHGYNCRHSHRPWDKDMGNPWRDDKGRLIDGNGNELSDDTNKKVYNDRAGQRKLERDIRKLKLQLLMKQEQIDATAETDVKAILQNGYDKLAYKLVKLNKAYNDYCKAKGLQPDYARNKVAGFTPKMQKNANAGAKREKARQ